MLATVNLNSKLEPCRVEIHNVVSNSLLTTKMICAFRQEIIPKATLFRSHVLSHLFCILLNFLVVVTHKKRPFYR